jgi:hypothetical protein
MWIAIAIAVAAVAVIYLNNYLSNKHDQRVSDMQERRRELMEETMERIRKSDEQNNEKN